MRNWSRQWRRERRHGPRWAAIQSSMLKNSPEAEASGFRPSLSPAPGRSPSDERLAEITFPRKGNMTHGKAHDNDD